MEKSVGFVKNNQQDKLFSTKKANKKEFKSGDKKFENVFNDTKKQVKNEKKSKNTKNTKKSKDESNVEKANKAKESKSQDKKIDKKDTVDNEKVSKVDDKVEKKALEEKIEDLKELLEKLGIELDESQIIKLAKNLNVKNFTDLSNFKNLTNEELVNHLKDFKGFVNELKNKLESKNSNFDQLRNKFDDLLKKLDGKIKEIKVKDPKMNTNKDSVEKVLDKMVKEASEIVNKVKSKDSKKTNELNKDQSKNVDIDKKQKKVIENTKKDAKDNKNGESKDQSKGKEPNKEILSKVNKENNEIKSANVKTNSNETKVDFQKDLDFYLKSKINQNKEIFSQVKSKISTQLNENASEMKLQLNPKSLGKVDMKISVEKNVVLAEIEVENAMVKQAIESNLNDLKNALSQKGYNLDELDVSLGNDDNSENSSNESFYESLFENDSLSENTDDVVELDQSQILNIMKKRQVAYLG